MKEGRDVKKIAITGNIASGKSFVSSLIQEMGYNVFNCDIAAREARILSKNAIMKELAIKDSTTEQILCAINKDISALDKLEKIIHPIILRRIREYSDTTNDCLFYEVPLLFEAGLARNFDYIICTICENSARLDRARKRSENKGEVFDIEQYNLFNGRQLDQLEKQRLSNFVIDTNCHIEQIKSSIKQIIQLIKDN